MKKKLDLIPNKINLSLEKDIRHRLTMIKIVLNIFNLKRKS